MGRKFKMKPTKSAKPAPDKLARRAAKTAKRKAKR